MKSQVSNRSRIFGVPSRLILIFGGSICVIGTALWVQWNFSEYTRKSPSPPASVQEIVDANAFPSTPNSELNAAVVQESTAAILPMDNSVDSPAIEISPEISATLDEIRLGLKQQTDAFLYFDEQLQPITESLHRLESAVRVQSSTTGQFEERMTLLEELVGELTVSLTESRLPGEPTEHLPPFRLVAIDRWNNEWNAVIELNGKISMIGLNASRAGWLLLQINPNSRSAVFRSETGDQVKLEVDG